MPVASLLSLSYRFVIENVCALESLVGFPESLGEKLFSELRKRWTVAIGSGRNQLIHGLSVFEEAYGPLLLDCANLSGQLIAINEFTECLLPLLTGVTTLDISHCQLGSRHEMWSHFSRMNNLTDLRLSDCSLTDDIVKAVTIPCRVTGYGIVNLEIFDVSCNPKLTKNCLRHLRCLTRLKTLYLSGTDITSTEASRFGDQFGMRLENGARTLPSIVTSGWAHGLIQLWVDSGRPFDSPRKEQRNHSGNCKFYASKRPAERIKMAEELKMSPPPKSHPELCLVRHRSVPGKSGCDVERSETPDIALNATFELDRDLVKGYMDLVPAKRRSSHKRNLFQMLSD